MSGRSFSTDTLFGIAERIRAIRGERTQREFAEQLGIDRATLANYERGRRTPNYETLKKISDVSGTDVPRLIFGEETKTPFQLYQQKIDKKLVRISRENPGYIPKWFISDDEIALIVCYRIATRSLEGDPIRCLEGILKLAEGESKEAPLYWEMPVSYGEEHIERLRAALERGELKEGYDPDHDLYKLLGYFAKGERRA